MGLFVAFYPGAACTLLLLYFYQGMASFKKHLLSCHTGKNCFGAEIEKVYALRCCHNQQQSLWKTIRGGQHHDLYEVTTLVGVNNRPSNNQKFYEEIQ